MTQDEIRLMLALPAKAREMLVKIDAMGWCTPWGQCQPSGGPESADHPWLANPWRPHSSPEHARTEPGCTRISDRVLYWWCPADPSLILALAAETLCPGEPDKGAPLLYPCKGQWIAACFHPREFSGTGATAREACLRLLLAATTFEMTPAKGTTPVS